MRKIKVVQIGIGHDHATNIFESLLRQKNLFEVAGFAVPDSEEADFARSITEYRENRKVPQLTVEEALNTPGLDGAVIETEEVNLTKYALLAAEKGLHIHMDKPGGLSLADFEKLIEIVKTKNLTFSTGYMYRFNPFVKKAIEKVKNGDIGDVYCVEAHMDCEHIAEKRQWLDRFPGGMMFYLGCHLIDLIYQLQGMPDTVVPMNISTGYDGVTAQDYGMALFKYPNGISFAKTCSAEPGGFGRRQLVVCGTKGTIEIKPLEAYASMEERPEPFLDMYTEMVESCKNQPWQDFGKHTKAALYNRYDSMMENYAQMACGEKENPYTYDYELNLYKLLLNACGKEVE